MKRKETRFLILFFIIFNIFLILIGCSNTINEKSTNPSSSKDTLMFLGESKNWIATFTVIFENEDTHKRYLDVKLKEKGSIKGIIEYALYKNGEKQTFGTGEAGSKIGGMGGGTGIAPKESDNYVLSIKWKDGEETFPLNIQNQ